MRAQSPNVLSILAADAWERVSGSDAALSQGRALAQNAIEQLGREEAEARAATLVRVRVSPNPNPNPNPYLTLTLTLTLSR